MNSKRLELFRQKKIDTEYFYHHSYYVCADQMFIFTIETSATLGPVIIW